MEGLRKGNSQSHRGLLGQLKIFNSLLARFPQFRGAAMANEGEQTGEMRLLLIHKVQKSELKRGDHIYAYRFCGTLSHHGIYLGKDKVAHYISDAPPSFATSSPSSEFSKTNSNVVITSLDEFLGNGSLHRVEYGVPRSHFFVKFRGGTFTFAPSDPPEEVVYRAIYLHNTGFGKYHLRRNNCEDFALYCKTGLQLKEKTRTGMSGQISQYKRAIKFGGLSAFATAGGFILGIAAGPAGLAPAAAAFVMSSISMFVKDLGNRWDVVKVEVEDLAAFRARRDEAAKSNKFQQDAIDEDAYEMMEKHRKMMEEHHNAALKEFYSI